MKMMIMAKVGVLLALFVLAMPALFWPTMASAKLSEELETILIDEPGDNARMFELFEREAVDPAGAAETYGKIMADTPEKHQRYRLSLLCRAIDESLAGHADLLEFLSSLPEDTRPFRSFLISTFLMARLDHLSEQEFQQLEVLMIQDLDKFVGRRDSNLLTGIYDLVSGRYYSNKGYAPADSDASFNILANCLCAARGNREKSYLAGALRHLRHQRVATLFKGELLGVGCLNRVGNVPSRIMLEYLADLPDGASFLAGLLSELQDDETYSMALLVCGSHEDFHNDLGFHRAVFRSLSQRSLVEGDGDESKFRAPGGVTWAISGYLHQVWPSLTEAIAFRPHELADHAGVISRFARRDSILEFAATYGNFLEEPFLSAFTEKIYSHGSTNEMKEMLEHVGGERLPAELRERAEHKANTKWISVMDKVIIIPEPSNNGDSSGRRRR